MVKKELQRQGSYRARGDRDEAVGDTIPATGPRWHHWSGTAWLPFRGNWDGKAF